MAIELMESNGSTDVAPPATGVQVSAESQIQPDAQQKEEVVLGSPAASVDGVSKASIAESAPAEFPEEAPKQEGWKNFRTAYQTQGQELTAAKARISELEQQVPQTESYLQITGPVEDVDFHSQLDKMRDEVPPYYNAVAWTIMERHLEDVLPVILENPDLVSSDLKNMVEASATKILTAYTGLQPNQIAEAIQAYRSGSGSYGGAQPFSGKPMGTQSPSTDVNQLAYSLGLNPLDPTHQPIIQALAAQQGQIAQLSTSVGSLNQAEEARTVQGASQRVTEQIGQMRTDLLAKVTVPQGYEHVKGEIEDRVTSAFERDPAVQQARKNLEGYYRQGTPDLRAAAAEVTKLQSRLAVHIKAIAEPRIAEVSEYEKLKSLVSQTQAKTTQIPPGTGQTVPQGGRPQALPSTGNAVEDTVNSVMDRYRASKLGRVSTT